MQTFMDFLFDIAFFILFCGFYIFGTLWILMQITIMPWFMGILYFCGWLIINRLLWALKETFDE